MALFHHFEYTSTDDEFLTIRDDFDIITYLLSKFVRDGGVGWRRGVWDLGKVKKLSLFVLNSKIAAARVRRTAINVVDVSDNVSTCQKIRTQYVQNMYSTNMYSAMYL